VIFLTDADLLQMAAPLKRPHAIRKWLDKIGIPYITGPTGWPRVPVAAVAPQAIPAQNQQPRLRL
jgi:hypothetical protein